MTQRGKILRDTNTGPGLLVAGGTQYPFELERHWKSELPPRVGMVVDVDVGPGGGLVAVRAVADSVLAREQADVAMQAVREKGGAMAGMMVARFGRRDLIAIGLLVLGWFVLKAGSFGGGMLGTVSFTFWQVLGFVNSGVESIGSRALGEGSNTGIWGMLAFVAIGGPFLHHFWRDRRATLAAALPLLLMLVVLWRVYGGIGDGGGDASMFGAEGEAMAAEMRKELRNAVSLGMGTYLSFAVAAYFAGSGLKRWLLSRA